MILYDSFFKQKCLSLEKISKRYCGSNHERIFELSFGKCSISSDNKYILVYYSYSKLEDYKLIFAEFLHFTHLLNSSKLKKYIEEKKVYELQMKDPLADFQFCISPLGKAKFFTLSFKNILTIWKFTNQTFKKIKSIELRQVCYLSWISRKNLLMSRKDGKVKIICLKS